MNQFEVSEKLLHRLIEIMIKENKILSQKYCDANFFVYMIPLTQLFWKINEEKDFDEINTPARLRIEMGKINLNTKQSTRNYITKRYFTLEIHDLNQRLKDLQNAGYVDINTYSYANSFYPIDKKITRTVWNEEREREEKISRIQLMILNIKSKLLNLLNKRDEDIVYLSAEDLLKELHELGFEYERKTDHSLDKYILSSEKIRLNSYMRRIGFKRVNGLDGIHRYKLYVIDREILEQGTK